MVIENQIPKTEMVCEIKNDYEVPSFEEFLKNYEYDEKVNYDDLSYIDIRDSKGYGPCIINSQLNYDSCRCSSEELDRQLKIIRNKRELEKLEREEKESERSAGASVAEALGKSGNNVPIGAPVGVGSAAAIAKIFGTL
jgi:hypothetical protein